MRLADLMPWRRAAEARSVTSTTTSANPAAWLINYFTQGSPASSGVRVTEETALRYTAVYRAVALLSEAVSTLPLLVYERTGDGSRRPAPEHPVQSLLHVPMVDTVRPGRLFRETLTAHVLLWGNAYAGIRTVAERPVALDILLPWQMRTDVDGGRVTYLHSMSGGGTERLTPLSVLHIPGLTINGLDGLSPIGLAREAVGLGLAAEAFGARFFGSGSHPGGVIEVPQELSDPASARIAQSWSDAYSGLTNAHKVAVLEQGATWKQIGIPPEDAQFLETRKHQVEDIARLYGIPAHKLGALDRATHSNIEQQSIEFVVDTLQPWLSRWESELNLKLFDETDRGRYYVEHVIEGRLRGDSAARGAFYGALWNVGGISVNEIRRLENMNPIDGGDQHFVPLNMVPLERAGELPMVPGDDAPPDDDEEDEDARADYAAAVLRLAPVEARDFVARTGLPRASIRALGGRIRHQETHARLFEEATRKVVRREVERVGSAARRHLRDEEDRNAFLAFLDQFYDEILGVIARHFGPVVGAFGGAVASDAFEEVNQYGELPAQVEEFVRQYIARMAKRYAATSREQLRDLVEGAGPGEDHALVEERLEAWEETRPQREAARQVIEAGGAFAKLAYSLAG